MERDSNRNHDYNDPDFNSEIMQDKEPAIDQHQYNFSNDEQNRDNDTTDPYFQKNASIAQDLLSDDDKDQSDPDRRTLDEYDANHAEPENELEELDDNALINQKDKSDEL